VVRNRALLLRSSHARAIEAVTACQKGRVAGVLRTGIRYEPVRVLSRERESRELQERNLERYLPLCVPGDVVPAPPHPFLCTRARRPAQSNSLLLSTTPSTRE
jgi:hypothetical protein